jgi:NAD(P)-dependent dehydrogenase (short-subunit alcohol dehydrogenase family)
MKDTASVLHKAFPHVVFHQLVADLTNEENVRRAVQETVQKFGSIDYAVNNAGIGQPLKPSSETSLADFDKLMAVNVKGVFLCEKYELLQMQKQEPHNSVKSSSTIRPASKGVIVNVSSILGFLAIPNLSLYNASKHGRLEIFLRRLLF